MPDEGPPLDTGGAVPRSPDPAQDPTEGLPRPGDLAADLSAGSETRAEPALPKTQVEFFHRAAEKAAGFPTTPGVYLMQDSAGHVIYVGKAKNLRARVATYFQPPAAADRRSVA